MTRAVPHYRESGRTYAADACAPLAAAAARGEVALHAWTSGHYPGRALPRGTLPGLKTVGSWDAPARQSWGLDWHRNEGIELTLFEGARLPFAVGDQDVALRSGDLTITRPWQRHRVGDPHVPAGRLHWLILDVGVRRPHQAWQWPPWLVLSRPDLRELAGRLRHNEQPVWHAGDDLRQCVRRVAHLVESDPTPDRLSWVTLHLNELFLLLLRLCRHSEAPLDEGLSSSLRTVELFLAELAADPDLLFHEWTLARLASHCGLGVTRFVHHCRQITDATPMHYLAACRLDAARESLRHDPGQTITEVAARCGFASSQYFATLFGRRFGEPPGAWRDRMSRPDAG
jgi:AraC family L-rhamnose operon regulatory protein RhaS